MAREAYGNADLDFENELGARRFVSAQLCVDLSGTCAMDISLRAALAGGLGSKNIIAEDFATVRAKDLDLATIKVKGSEAIGVKILNLSPVALEALGAVTVGGLCFPECVATPFDL